MVADIVLCMITHKESSTDVEIETQLCCTPRWSSEHMVKLSPSKWFGTVVIHDVLRPSEQVSEDTKLLERAVGL